jgi:MinD superfamily P-loop ATPase
MIISVASGKGGTGKTSLVAAFASLAENKVLCDADVDAADLHLMMNPSVQERHDFPLNACGEWFRSDTSFGPMIHARLDIA